ncbi:hypothetical protein GCM10028805_39370 [Spirosoma harenae]
MKRRTFLTTSAKTGFVAFITPSGIVEIAENKVAVAPKAVDSLVAAFVNPPMSARAQCWWHWMNGNVTADGITRDLEAMKQIGLGGFQNFDAGTGIPKGPVVYLSPEWLKLKQHTIKEAERLGLEFTMHNCPGWSSSGGPWITPELAMQEVTWSEAYVAGGQSVTVNVPQPLSRLNYYRDIAVLAYPSLPGETALSSSVDKITVNGNDESISIERLAGAEGVIVQPTAEGQPTTLLLAFKEPYEARSIAFLSKPVGKSSSGGGGFGGGPQLTLEVSDDGVQFRKVSTASAGRSPEYALSLAEFQPTTAKHFRITSPGARQYAQLRFSGTARLADWRKKVDNVFGVTELPADHDTVGKTSIDPASLVDVTQFMDKAGVLRWHAPAGNWTILRIGYTPKGELNRSAPDTGVGLECDKYNSAAIDFHFKKMMENLLPTLKPLTKKGKVGLLIDSYEVGMQNWTAQFPQEFQKRAGYLLLNYLPTLTGRVVGNIDTTERFLWDFRRVLADLIADNYYGRFTALCHQQGIIAYTEPYDRGPMEEMQIGARVDVNMGEFWHGLSSLFQNNQTMRRTTKLAASIAHINGKTMGGGTSANPQIVGAEAFTGEPESARWQEYPFGMKALGDKMFTQGLNRIIFHRYAHQPHPTAAPGMTMGPWGIHFDRTTTWWNQGRAWLDYLARSQSMLQQGLFVADLAYFTGEGGNQYTKVEPHELTPTPPQGYDYDLINGETLLKRARIQGNTLMLPDGMSYRILVLQDHQSLSLALLRKLHGFVKAGLVLIGVKPSSSLGLRGFTKNDADFQQLANELWGSIDGKTITENRLGNGRVIWGQPIQTVLASLGIQPDVDITSRSGDAPITWIHRRVGDKHIYFLANQRRSVEETVCTFRVSGKQPEYWDAATGKMTPIPIYESEKGQTRLPVHFDPSGSVFVVFRNPAQKPLQAIVKRTETLLSVKPFPGSTRKLNKDVVNNFTISVWAKPELNSMLSPTGFLEHVKEPWTDYYAIYPSAGADLYGTGHTTCGLTIGRNGVAVWERTTGNPVFRMAAPTAISGWSHVALVYTDGIPSVYVNGQLIQQGKGGGNSVHPGTGLAYLGDGASFYNGDITEPQLITESLSADRIQQLSLQSRPKSFDFLPVTVSTNGKSGLLFWQDGQYILRGQNGKDTTITVSQATPVVELNDDWQVRFPPNLGAPEQIKLPNLMPLNMHAQDGVRHFSGTATYSKTFTISSNRRSITKRLFLDLGQVEVIASVVLNGKSLGTLWKRPYRLDVTDAVINGPNNLEINVTNLWPNRLIGDEQLPDPDKFTPGGGASGFASLSSGAIMELPDWYKDGKPKPVDGRVTFTTWKHYNKDSPLLESGLIGPVQLREAELKLLT